MLRKQRIGFVLRVSLTMITYYVVILMNSFRPPRQFCHENGKVTSSTGMAGDADFPDRIIPPFPFALSTATINFQGALEGGRWGNTI